MAPKDSFRIKELTDLGQFRQEYTASYNDSMPARRRFPAGYRSLIGKPGAANERALSVSENPAMNKSYLLMAMIELFPEQVLAAASSLRMNGTFDPNDRKRQVHDQFRDELNDACTNSGVAVRDISMRAIHEYRSFDLGGSPRVGRDEVEIIIRGRQVR